MLDMDLPLNGGGKLRFDSLTVAYLYESLRPQSGDALCIIGLAGGKEIGLSVTAAEAEEAISNKAQRRRMDEAMKRSV